MFNHRAEGKEFLDDPQLDPASAEKSYHYMSRVNRLLGGVALVRRFIEQNAPKDRRVRLLDVGSGICDIPLAVASALKDTHNLDFTCVEPHPVAVQIARQHIAGADLAVRVIQQDIFQYRPQEQFDYAIASLFIHHLSDDEIINLIQHLRQFTRKAVFINDLYRSPTAYLACKITTLFLDRYSRYDALLSIRKGFTESELTALLAPLNAPQVEVCRRFVYRITAAVHLQPEHP